MHLGRVLHQEAHIPGESGDGPVGADQPDVWFTLPSRLARCHQTTLLPYFQTQEAVPQEAQRRIQLVSISTEL